MENASKALVMAGGVLIGILIMSLAVYLFVSFGGETAKVYDRNAEQQIVAFNTEYTKYQGKDDITIYDIISVVNKAKENNNYYEVTTYTEDNEYIQVWLGNTSLENKAQEQLNEYIIAMLGNSETTDLQKYKCTDIKFSTTTGKVKSIQFKY